jgi:hypothetical protein
MAVLSFIPQKARPKLDSGKTAFYVRVMTARNFSVALTKKRENGRACKSPVNNPVFHTFHSHVGNVQNKYYGYLTFGIAVVVLEMVRGFLKATGRAGDSQSGLKYSQVQIL